MTRDNQPNPPDLPDYVCDAIRRRSSKEELEAVIQYAESLLEYRRQNLQPQDDADENRRSTNIDDLPRNGAPERATLTKKQIDGQEYYYWQWRENSTVESAYCAPVDGNDLSEEE
ncbi:hypothetical protein [Natrinema salaciae]|uniref:Uncharacterized protein n=1 Tax=Natrinema salaciae TaxID=1186196 RepID=A0A1H9CNR0_9EURY|nr:hypothetical protein [Natrinema salaciae]SEQ02836.1 hypothetical protein SAMN04489841_1110 [Natrinema salaciae]